ncbi:hypothetical protein [Zunongwangia profunda]|uniref:Uncharacterized protein n=1 Tax=Zunongwangia profunda TaxID=398743 RepID=A0A3D5IWJ0_9FLAO|nr:hypothetical protein [Zunongwangia profunda]MAC64667.1 hypothetical protein [Flavobacteriaceae bacterium]MAS71442.1 hypothetical protein [Zunongwangia sp.]HAJ82091.1 hypothetical protein [Zunongwangia profunda]HCV80053.1 hypothetical protein [Zunongwangia profunda]|tara:strand:- start:1516 stop:2166 length:651 start_codon:yes stop_codon:yes gene_type:complete
MRLVIQLLLWAVIAFLAWLTFDAVYRPIQFNKVKEQRYPKVIENLKDIRAAELAHKEIVGNFEGDFNKLVQFIDTAEFAITQRRDTTVLDEEYKKNYGVDEYIEKVLIDTLDFVPVKDSLFKGNRDRYTNMINVPIKGTDAKIELEAGNIKKGDSKIPVFEAKVAKSVILYDQDKQLILQENEAQSVEEVNGRYISVGSMEEIKTTGNWPQTYGDQ